MARDPAERGRVGPGGSAHREAAGEAGLLVLGVDADGGLDEDALAEGVLAAEGGWEANGGNGRMGRPRGRRWKGGAAGCGEVGVVELALRNHR
jgi:hypothetical protein